MRCLTTAGYEKVFVEKASGAQQDRPQLKAALNYMRPRDTLVVWKLNLLTRSMTQLIETAEHLGAQGRGCKSLIHAQSFRKGE